MWPGCLFQLLEKSHHSVLCARLLAEPLHWLCYRTCLTSSQTCISPLPVCVWDSHRHYLNKCHPMAAINFGNFPQMRNPLQNQKTQLQAWVTPCPQCCLSSTHHFSPCTNNPTRYRGLTSEWNHSHHFPFPKSCILQLSSETVVTMGKKCPIKAQLFWASSHVSCIHILRPLTKLFPFSWHLLKAPTQRQPQLCSIQVHINPP